MSMHTWVRGFCLVFPLCAILVLQEHKGNIRLTHAVPFESWRSNQQEFKPGFVTDATTANDSTTDHNTYAVPSTTAHNTSNGVYPVTPVWNWTHRHKSDQWTIPVLSVAMWCNAIAIAVQCAAWFLRPTRASPAIRYVYAALVSSTMCALLCLTAGANDCVYVVLVISTCLGGHAMQFMCQRLMTILNLSGSPRSVQYTQTALEECWEQEAQDSVSEVMEDDVSVASDDSTELDLVVHPEIAIKSDTAEKNEASPRTILDDLSTRTRSQSYGRCSCVRRWMENIIHRSVYTTVGGSRSTPNRAVRTVGGNQYVIIFTHIAMACHVMGWILFLETWIVYSFMTNSDTGSGFQAAMHTEACAENTVSMFSGSTYRPSTCHNANDPVGAAVLNACVWLAVSGDLFVLCIQTIQLLSYSQLCCVHTNPLSGNRQWNNGPSLLVRMRTCGLNWKNEDALYLAVVTIKCTTVSILLAVYMLTTDK